MKIQSTVVLIGVGGHLLVKSCLFHKLFLLSLFVVLVCSHLGYESENLVLIVIVPGLCLPFISNSLEFAKSYVINTGK